MSHKNMKRVLIYDKDPIYCQFIKTALEKINYQPLVCSDFSFFQRFYVKEDPVLIMMDLDLQDETGLDILDFLAFKKSQEPIIFMGSGSLRLLQTLKRLAQGLSLNVDSVLQKPFTVGELLDLLSKTRSSSLLLNEDSLAEAIEKKQIIPYYQPQMNIATGKVDGFEALARWITDEGEIIMPGSFIQLAEDKHLIPKMTLSVIEQVCHDIKSWKYQGYDFNISVNVSAYCLTEDFVARLMGMISKHKIIPADVTLEITESVAISQQAETVNTLFKLKDIGFKLSIDDFGTGYSSLVALHRMPFTELKIDASFVSNMTDDRDAEIITRSLIDLAHNLSLIVVAEGVEDERSLAALSEMGCDLAQGFYLSRALAFDAVLPWVTQEEKKIVSISNVGHIRKA